MKPITFSICIPNYNYAKYIGETIRSVLDQDYPHFEIIVADNASTDDSVKVVESFRDERIRLVRNRYNIGFAPNLQRVTMLARNDFVNLLSSDDLMGAGTLRRYADAIAAQGDRAERTVLISDVQDIDSQGRPIAEIRRPLDGDEPGAFPSTVELDYPAGMLGPFPTTYRMRGREILIRVLPKLRTFAEFLTITYHRSLWEDVEGYNALRTIGPDKFFNYKLLSLDPDVIYVREPLFRYRMHVSPNAMAQQSTLKQQIDDYLYTIEYSEAFLKNLGIRREDMIRQFLDRVCLKTGLTQLVYGTYTHAVRAWAFALASYPAMTLRRPRFYALTGLLALGPLARWPARAFYHLVHRKTAAAQPPEEAPKDQLTLAARL